MSRKFTLVKDYYGLGFDIYKKKTIAINSGVTVLVGCNGIGKTTFLKQITNTLKKENVQYIEFDNFHDGGGRARANAGHCGDIDFLAMSMISSEGENIVMNLDRIAGGIGNFVKNNPNNKDLWIILDAIDSGLSVDNVVGIKELFKTILEDKRNKDREIYIIVSANEYEMAREEQCFDVCNGKYIKFKDYEEYRNFILESKEWKCQRNTNSSRED